MTSRSMIRSVSAPATDTPTPASVSLVLQSTPFKPSSTRRNLATSYRAFKAAWTAIEQVQVLSTSCRRLGERAAKVLNAVREKLELIDGEEREKLNGKVVLEKAYEFQKGKEGEDSAGKTVFRIQSTMLDLQAFATDHLANSTQDRLTLLVDSLPKTTKSLAKLSTSLLSCISTYSISPTVSNANWTEEDAADREKDYSALPRLFQLSIVLKGPIYNRFIASRIGSVPSTETPGQRRAAFIECCLEQTPILRPTQGGGSSIIRATPKSSWSTTTETIGLGLPVELTAGGSLMRRAVSQPPLTSVEAPTIDSKPIFGSVTPEATTALLNTVSLSAREEEEPTAENKIESTEPISLTFDPANVEVPASPPPFDLADPFPSLSTTDQTPASSAAPPVASLTPLPPKPFDNDEPSSHFLDRSTSTVSSMAMTTSSSMGSVLFEPVLPPFDSEVSQGEEETAEVEDEGQDQDRVEIFKYQALRREEEEAGLGEAETVETAEEDDTKESGFADRTNADLAVKAVQTDTLPSAFNVPLPLSPLAVEEIGSSPIIDAPRRSSTPAPLDLLPSPQIDLPLLSPTFDDTPLLQPPPLPPSPALPQSPSLIVTSFDDATDDIRPSVPPKSPSPFRILSLDGGGLVGPIPQLLALKKHLASTINSSLPSQHFDLIVGTSSSALPALILGQYGLSIDETLDICARVARQALRLEGTASAPGQTKPKRGGKWSRLFSKSSRTTSAVQAIPRRTALDSAIKQFVPGTSPLPASRSSCQTAILAYQRSNSASSRASECWLDSESDLSLLEIVRASMALPGSMPSPYIPSPTSLNPASSALTLAQSLLDSPDRSLELVSLSIGYSLASITLDPKRTSRTRLDALRQIKQYGAGNSATAEALRKRLEKDKRVKLVRIEAGCDGAELARADEGDLVESLQSQIEGRRRAVNTDSGRNRQMTPQATFSPRLSPLPSSPSTKSMHSPQSTRKRFPFFTSSAARRSASSYDISSTLSQPPSSPPPPSSPSIQQLYVKDERGLRTSISLGDLGGRTRGLYALEEGGSMSDLLSRA